MKTYSAKPADIEKKWYVIDADGLILGRMAAVIATYLKGKHKPMYTPSMDCGDNIIVINAEKVQLSGKKKDNKIYYWHTGYPGGIKEKNAGNILEGDYPERVVIKAVQRMLNNNPMGRQQLRNLRVFTGPEHTHEAQQPEILDVAAMNEKNARISANG